ncbi:MAG: hypothetical protein IPK55_10855 [Streptococcus sp.]|nr:hypothetical protein [Streptococcus sp.]
MSESNKSKLLTEISTDGVIDNYKLAAKIKEELKKRDLPQNLKSLFENYQGELFEQSPSPQMVETLIFSLLKNNVVRPKFPGEHYILVTSPLFDRGDRDLNFYQFNKDKNQQNAKVVFKWEFLKLLNIPRKCGGM